MGSVFGEHPYLECSTKGEKRLSPAYATFRDRVKLSTMIKVIESRQADDRVLSQLMHESVWATYLNENPDLIRMIVRATGLSDTFGRHNELDTANTLWRLRQRYIEEAVRWL